MRLIFIVSVLLLATTAPAAQWTGWHNALAPKGDATPITLVVDGKPVYTVTHRADGTPAEKKAAEDLNHWIKEMTGTDLARSGGPLIEINIDESLPLEGYKIELKEKNLYLTGAPGRGVINAVYAFLEEDLGCRFYTNESIKLPKSPTLTVSVIPRTYAPQLRLRDPYYAFAFDATWSLRNRTNAPGAVVPEEFGGHVDYADKFVHTAASLVPADKYFKAHPEYYFLGKDGKRNAAQLDTTNPDVIKIATQTVLDTLKKNPHTEIISVSKNDSGGDQLCQCDRCKKIRDEEGGAEMAVQLFMVNQIAEAIEKDYPNVSIDTLAYLDTIAVPKTVRPRKNVVIRLCNDVVGAWSHPFTPAEKNPVAQIARDWGKAHNRIYVWDYHVNFSHYLAPMPNVDVIASNIRFWIKNNAEGVMLQAGYQGPAERDELKSWVASKILWDPSRDENELTQDFIWGHYGKAAPAIAEYDALLVKAGKDHEKDLASPPGGIRYPMDTSFLSKDFIDKATTIFNRAADQAKEEADVLKKVERAKLPILYVQAARGPQFTGPDNYGKVLGEFERIARANKIQYLEEAGANFEPWLAQHKALIPKPVSHKVISHGKEAYTYQAFPDACRLKNGDIVAVFYAGYGHVSLEADDFPNGGRICLVRSTDEGRTWSQPQVLFDDADDNRDPHIAQLDDGSLVCTFFSWHHTGPRYKSIKEYSGKTWRTNAINTGAQMVRSTDNGQTWETTAHNIFPKWTCSAPIRQLPDGTCLLSLYDDQTGAVARSSDRGATWTLSEIPNPKQIDLDAETDVIALSPTRLYAALRSSKVHMHYATSDDKGATWSEPTDIGFDGHCPHLNRLSTGEIILSHRKPATDIHISRDEAKTWQGPYEIDSCIGAYPATVELRDGSVLIVYYSEGAGSEIRAKRFRIKADGIEFLELR